MIYSRTVQFTCFVSVTAVNVGGNDVLRIVFKGKGRCNFAGKIISEIVVRGVFPNVNEAVVVFKILLARHGISPGRNPYPNKRRSEYLLPRLPSGQAQTRIQARPHAKYLLILLPFCTSVDGFNIVALTLCKRKSSFIDGVTITK